MNEKSTTSLKSFKTSQAKHIQLVNAALSSESQEYWQQHNKINLQMQNTSISKVFDILEVKQPLFALSRQIMLSSSIEKITGTFISDKMQIYRGFLLTWEKILILFYLFEKIAKIEGLNGVRNSASQGIISNQDTFEDLWGERFPIAVVRPGLANKTLDYNSPLKIQNMINSQRRLSKKIIKGIRGSSNLRNRLKNIVILSKAEILTTGLTGPIARASNINPPIISLTSNSSQKDFLFYQQYAYASSPSPLALLEICFTELQLAIERLSFLAHYLHGHIEVNSIRETQGHFTCLFPVCFGVNYLTIELEGNQVKYINFIPFELGNLYGITELISKNSKKIHLFLLLFLNPEISLEI